MENLATMKGRSTRGQYAAIFGAFIVLQLLAAALGGAAPFIGLGLGCAAQGFMIMAACRRSHDCGRSGWFLLIPFYTIWLFFESGQVGDNRFGADPRKTVVTRPLA